MTRVGIYARERAGLGQPAPSCRMRGLVVLARSHADLHDEDMVTPLAG